MSYYFLFVISQHTIFNTNYLYPIRDVGDIAAEHRQGTQVLLDMCIWQEVKDQQGNTAIRLSSTFRENLKVAMLGGWVLVLLKRGFPQDIGSQVFRVVKFRGELVSFPVDKGILECWFIGHIIFALFL